MEKPARAERDVNKELTWFKDISFFFFGFLDVNIESLVNVEEGEIACLYFTSSPFILSFTIV